MADIKRALHIGLTVTDIERSIAFYEKVGLKLLSRVELDEEFISSKECLYHFGKKDMTCHLAFMEAPGGMQIEMFQFSDLQPTIEVPWNRAGQTHMCFISDDVQGMFDKLVAAGAEVALPPVKGMINEFMFVRDPDGNLIEVSCPLKK